MRILILSQHFWPEHFPINDVARVLAAHGHSVTVGTGKPNYPEGVIFDGYSAHGTHRESMPGADIEIVRVPLRPRGDADAWGLIRNYLSYIWNGIIHFPRLLRGRRFDAIVVFASSPLLQAIPAVLLRWTKGAHLAVWVQDLWPESLAGTGYVRNRFLLWLAGLPARFIYYFSDTVLVQSEAFFEPVARYTRGDKIVSFPNGTKAGSFATTGQAIPTALERTLGAHFCVVFAGNIGTAQSMETVVAAAQELRHDARVRIVLVGSGQKLDWVRHRKESLELDTLVLAGRFPPEAMPEIYRRAAVLLLSLNDEPIFARTVPSKLQGYLAAGRPIVASVRGEAARVVTEAGAGLACDPGDASALAAAIRTMAGLSSAERAAMGAAGREYFTEHFDLDRQMRSLVRILEERS
jgi:glycosyltransferase involved in cell wall biosynthesis